MYKKMALGLLAMWMVFSSCPGVGLTFDVQEMASPAPSPMPSLEVIEEPAEAVVEVLFHADALSRMQDNLSARLHDVFYAVYAAVNRSLGELLVLVGIVKLNDQIASASVDDVLHLGPVEIGVF